MKEMIVMKFARMLAVSCIFALASTTVSAQSVTKLRFQSVFPPSGYIFENSKYFAERVKA